MDSDQEEYEEEYTYEEDGEYDDQEIENSLVIEEEEEENTKLPAGDAPIGGASSIGGDKLPSVMSPSSGQKSNRSSLGSSAGKKNVTIVVPEDDYIITSCSNVEPVMTALVKEVASLLDIHPDMAQHLLYYNKWDKERLIDSFFSNSEKALADAGLDLFTDAIVSAANPLSLSLTPAKCPRIDNLKPSSAIFTCRICYNDQLHEHDCYNLGCGHKFCRECFSQYVSKQVESGPASIAARCPEHKCTQSGKYKDMTS